MDKNQRKHYNAPVVLCFAAICFIATLLGSITDGKSTVLLFMTYHSPLSSPLTYLRFFTHVFGHNGWDHFFHNMLMLLLVGPMLEDEYGHRLIAVMIPVTAVIIGVLNYICFPDTALCGASGVVFAFVLFAAVTNIVNRKVPILYIVLAALLFGKMFMDDFRTVGISWMAHLVGGLIGGAAGLIYIRHYDRQ